MRRRTPSPDGGIAVVLLLIVVSLIGVACSQSADVSSDRTEESDQESVATGSAAPTQATATSGPTAAPLAPTTPDTAADAAGIAQYTWWATIVDWDPETESTTRAEDVLQGQIDRSRNVALLTFSPDDLGDNPSEELIAYFGDRSLTLGASRYDLAWRGPGQPDPDTWYETDVSTPGLPDFLSGDGTPLALSEALGVASPVNGRIEVDAEVIAALPEGGDHFVAAFDRVGGSLDFGFWLEFISDDAGRVIELTLGALEYDNDFGMGELDGIEIRFEYDTGSFEMPDPAEALAVPNPSDDELAIADALSGHHEVAMRLNVYLGRSLNVVLTPDHELVLVKRADIWAGPDDFVRWQLTPTGSERVLAAALENPAVASGVYNVLHPEGVALDIGGGRSELNAYPDLPPGSPQLYEEVEQLIETLQDPSWLEGDIVRGPEPWVPENLTAIARPEDGRIDAVWPLDRTIRELGFAGSERHEGATVLCLVGDDAATAWSLLAEPVNNAHVGIDDGESWDVSFWLAWPGYRIYGDPCHLDPYGYDGDVGAQILDRAESVQVIEQIEADE